MTSVSAVIRGYLATLVNSTNMESERYSDNFNPMPDIMGYLPGLKITDVHIGVWAGGGGLQCLSERFEIFQAKR